MHDFCFTPLYSGILLLGGLMAWASKGSTVSLVASGISAVVTGGCAYVSMDVWIKQKKKCVPAVGVCLLVALAIAGKMGQSWAKNPTGNIAQGALCVASAGMACYYAWNLALFTPHQAKPVQPMDMAKLKEDAKQYADSKKEFKKQ